MNSVGVSKAPPTSSTSRVPPPPTKVLYRIVLWVRKDSFWRSTTAVPNLFLKLFGSVGETPFLPLFTKWSTTGDLLLSSFNVRNIGTISKLRVGIDRQTNPLYLEKISIWNLVDGLENLFECDKLLIPRTTDSLPSYYEFSPSLAKIRDTKLANSLITRKRDTLIRRVEKEYTHSIEIKTANSQGAGTSAKVYITLIGSQQRSREFLLDNNEANFERGRVDIFQVEAPDIGELKKIILRHDATGDAPDWMVDCVSVKNLSGGKMSYFYCPLWFSKTLDDGQIEREILPSSVPEANVFSVYWIMIRTGNAYGSETIGDVSLQMFGTKQTSRRLTFKSTTTSFRLGKTDLFSARDWDIGDIVKINIQRSEHGGGWFLEDVTIKNLSTGKSWFFYAQCWISQAQGDRQLQKDLVPVASVPMIPYYISVVTGNVRNAGTDAEVSIELFGELGHSGSKPLRSGKQAFETGQTDFFRIECPDLGELQRIRIGHNGKGLSKNWFLERVVVTSSRQYYFDWCHWIGPAALDKRNYADIPASITDHLLDTSSIFSHYKITVVTGDIEGAGTDANVFIELFGELGTSGRIPLDGPANEFEQGRTDTFITTCLDLGPLRKILIGHDGKGLGSSWFLTSVTVENASKGQEFYFPCNRWLSTSEDDGLTERELPACTKDGKNLAVTITYQIAVITGTVKGGGTDANVFIQLFGAKGNSGKRSLNKPKERFGVKNTNMFEVGKTDYFELQCVDLGDLQKILIGHDNSGLGSGWFLDKVTIQTSDNKFYQFPCRRWMDQKEDDGKIERELFPEKVSAEVMAANTEYIVTVITGSVTGADDISNVSLSLIGDKGKHEKKPLATKQQTKKPFQRSAVDQFSVVGTDVGALQSIVVSAEGKAWFLDKILVRSSQSQAQWVFPCGRWFARNQDDGQMERTLLPGDPTKEVTYRVSVQTGNTSGAGTDANVYLIMRGDAGQTPRIPLQHSITNMNKFESGKVDVFIVAASNIGKLSSLVIGHDGKGFGSGWYLEAIEVENLITNEKQTFPCRQWLDEGKADKKLERVLLPQQK